ncbi:unnamed protein product [Camellia sinensis]
MCGYNGHNDRQGEGGRDVDVHWWGHAAHVLQRAELNICSTNVDFLHHKGGHVVTLHPHDSNDVVGALLVVSCCVSGAIGLIAKAKMIQDYPCVYSSTALIMTMTAIQAIGFALSALHG